MSVFQNPIPTNKPGMEPKRPSRPVNITPICRISSTVPNQINISWASELGRVGRCLSVRALCEEKKPVTIKVTLSTKRKNNRSLPDLHVLLIVRIHFVSRVAVWSKYFQSYCVAVFLVRKLSSDTLLGRLKQNGKRHPDHTRALSMFSAEMFHSDLWNRHMVLLVSENTKCAFFVAVKDKLRHDPDSEIATTSLRVSLNCPVSMKRRRWFFSIVMCVEEPLGLFSIKFGACRLKISAVVCGLFFQLGKMRMTVPSRATTCNHLQCFDVQMFLQMNEKKPTWTCPVCDKAAEFSKLIIDG